MTWLGLIAAAAGWRWTSQTFFGPAWGHAWLYANLALATSLFVLFPSLTTNVPATKIENRRWYLISHGLVLLLAGVPILTTAGWLNAVTMRTVISAAAVQLAFVTFILGLSARFCARNTTGLFSYAALVGLFLLPPEIALIQASNFPWLTGGLWSNWITVFPAEIIAAACHYPFPHTAVAWMAGVYAVAGIALLASAHDVV